MKLLLFNENQQINYFGKCKIVVNSLNKTIIVTPLEQDFKGFSYSFNQEVIKQNNLLFVLASEHFLCDFILIFPSIESCNKIFDVLQKSIVTNANESPNAIVLHSTVFQQRFFDPILGSCQTKNPLSEHLKEFLYTFLKSLEENERQKYQVYINKKFREFYSEILEKYALKEFGTNDNDFDDIVDETNKVNKQLGMVETCCNLRKRPRNEVNIQQESGQNDSFDEDYQIEQSDVSYSEDETIDESEIIENCQNHKRFKHNFEKGIVEAPNFKLLSFDEYGTLRKRLFIFPIEDKTMCYVYGWCNTAKRYICRRCKNRRINSKEYYLTAIVCKDNQDQEYVKLNHGQHHCSLIKYEPENYSFSAWKRIIKIPNFKLDSYQKNGMSKKRLFIFTSLEKKLGYYYLYLKNCDKFFCCGCHNLKVQTTAKKFEDNSGEECIKISNTKHVCEIRTYGIEYGMKYHVLYKPDYQIIEKSVYGIKKRKLYIINQENRDLCYEFTYALSTENFICYGCYSHSKQNFRAFFCYDENGNEFIRVFDRLHVCQPLPYPINFNEDEDEDIIRPPEYQFLNRKVRRKLVDKLVVFANEEKTLCYEYNKTPKRPGDWMCRPCQFKFKVYVHVKYVQENDLEYIVVGKNKHQCKPIEFKPEDLEFNIIKTPNFILENGRINFRKKESKRLAVLDKNDSTLCYYYWCIQGNTLFRCSKCYSKNMYVTATHCKDKNGEEYLQLNVNQHICELEKYVPFKSNFKTVNLPNFYFQKSKRSNFDSLVIRDGKENNLWYTYGYFQGINVYNCNKCNLMKKTISARLCKVEDGEDYIELSPSEHVCKPEPKNKKL